MCVGLCVYMFVSVCTHVRTGTSIGAGVCICVYMHDHMCDGATTFMGIGPCFFILFRSCCSFCVTNVAQQYVYSDEGILILELEENVVPF